MIAFIETYDGDGGITRAMCIGVCMTLALLPSCNAPSREESPVMTEEATRELLPAPRPRQVESTELSRPAVLRSTPASNTLQTYFHIWRFRLQGSWLASSESLWNHLDETAIAPDQYLRLKCNGMRVGLGSDSSWSVIHSILQAERPEVWTSSVIAQPGMALSLELESGAFQDPLFWYDTRGRLAGALYSGYSKSFLIEHTPDLGRLGEIRLRIVPRMQCGLRSRVVRLYEGIHQSPLEEMIEFQQLACSLTLQQDQFILIGPSDASRMEHLLGSRFLCERQGEEVYGNLYCLRPRIVRTGEVEAESGPGK